MTTMTYVVNRASSHPRQVEVTYNGEVAVAMITELEVELYDPDATHGTLCFRFSKKAEVDEATALFVPGSKVAFDLSGWTAVSPAPVAAVEDEQ